ncbi:MAG: BolA family protein [Gammaproteobacteria bacterium]
MSELNRVELIRECLEETLNPTQLEIVDDSHLHAGHSGHGGAGHFQVHIVSNKFNGLAILARHRLVYSALENMMQTEIHALSIKAQTSDETE